jgi:molybdopterin synthase sulfur carrier subunit
MAVKVKIPTPLQRLTNKQSQVEAEGSTVGEVLADLERNFPGFKERLYDEKEELRRFINIFLNEEDVRFLEGLNTTVKDGDEISIIPAVAGGSL